MTEQPAATLTQQGKDNYVLAFAKDFIDFTDGETSAFMATLREFKPRPSGRLEDKRVLVIDMANLPHASTTTMAMLLHTRVEAMYEIVITGLTPYNRDTLTLLKFNEWAKFADDGVSPEQAFKDARAPKRDK